jgi:hypothetical protein
MKNLSSITLEIKMAIIEGIHGCECRHKGIKREIVKLKEFHPALGFNYVDKFDLAEIPTIGSVTTSIDFTALVLIDMGRDGKQQDYASGNFGPVTISYSSSEYNIDMSNSLISGLSTD